VALKVSKPPTGSDDDHAQSFAREYAALSALRHPGVVQIFEYGMHDHCEFLAMEYFPCGDLKQRLQQPITPEQSIEYVRRIALALQPVHAAGLMHRDLKPPNVMLRADCSVVLIDFGLAKRQNALTASTELGIRRGSPYYMSPEQVQGLPLDSRSDLYSLGVIFYEMLTGRKPYTGATAIELMDRHVSGERPALPADLSQYEPLLQSMMTVEREDRVPNAGTLLELLRDHQPDHFDLGRLDAANAG
jgi:serine/threonine-protein kinase PpkA